MRVKDKIITVHVNQSGHSKDDGVAEDVYGHYWDLFWLNAHPPTTPSVVSLVNRLYLSSVDEDNCVFSLSDGIGK